MAESNQNKSLADMLMCIALVRSPQTDPAIRTQALQRLREVYDQEIVLPIETKD